MDRYIMFSSIIFAKHYTHAESPQIPTPKKGFSFFILTAC